MENNINIASNIRLIRTLRGVKVESIAKELGISKGEYSKIENNYRKNFARHIKKISSILNFNFEEFTDPININENIIRLMRNQIDSSN